MSSLIQYRLLFGAVLTVLSLPCYSEEPEYGGRTLSGWVAVYFNGLPNHPPPATRVDMDAATSAIRAIGTNALPLVLRKMRKAKPSDVDFARTVLDLLGDEATPAIPSLAQLTKHKEKAVRVLAFHTIIGLNADKGTMLPILTRLSSDVDFGVRSDAASIFIEKYPDEAKVAGVTERNVYDKDLIKSKK